MAQGGREYSRLGVILPFVAVVLTAALLLCGLALDGGRLLLTWMRLQRAADAGATVTMYELGRALPNEILELMARTQAEQNLVASGITQEEQYEIQVSFNPPAPDLPLQVTVRVEATIPLILMRAIPGMGSISTVRADATGQGVFPLALAVAFPVALNATETAFDSPCPVDSPVECRRNGFCNSFCLERNLIREIVEELKLSEFVALFPYAQQTLPANELWGFQRLDEASRQEAIDFIGGLTAKNHNQYGLGVCSAAYPAQVLANICLACPLRDARHNFASHIFAGAGLAGIPLNRRVLLLAHALPLCQEWYEEEHLFYEPLGGTPPGYTGLFGPSSWHFSCGHLINAADAPSKYYGGPIAVSQFLARRQNLFKNRIALDVMPLGRPVTPIFNLPPFENDFRNAFWWAKDHFRFFEQMANVGVENDYGNDANPNNPPDQRIYPRRGLVGSPDGNVDLYPRRTCLDSFATGDLPECSCRTMVGRELPRGLFAPMGEASAHGQTIEQFAVSIVRRMRELGPQPRLIE